MSILTRRSFRLWLEIHIPDTRHDTDITPRRYKSRQRKSYLLDPFTPIDIKCPFVLMELARVSLVWFTLSLYRYGAVSGIWISILRLK